MERLMLKQTRYRNRKILAHARGQQCTMNLTGICNFNPETTVAAHSGLIEDGKGMGLKGHDLFVAFMCSDCHDVYDGRRKVKPPFEKAYLVAEFHKAMKKTQLLLVNDGVIK